MKNRYDRIAENFNDKDSFSNKANNHKTHTNMKSSSESKNKSNSRKHSKKCCNTLKVYGTFGTLKPLTVIGTGNLGSPTNIPLDYTSQSPITTTDYLQLTTDGAVSVTVSGVYLVNAKIQLACGSGALFCVSVNGSGINVPYYNEGGGTGNGSSIITSILPLCAGDLVSIGIVSNGPTTLSYGDAFDPSITVTTAALRLVKVSDYTCKNENCGIPSNQCNDYGAFGTFANYNEISVVGSGNIGFGTTIPLSFSSPAPVNTPDAFTLNDDGTITINIPGIYMVNAKLQVACGSGALWGVFINNGGINVQYYNESGVTGNCTGVIGNILSLCAGDIVSLGVVSKGVTTLTWGDDFNTGVQVSTAALRLVKIADYDCTCDSFDALNSLSNCAFSSAYGTLGSTSPLSVIGSGNSRNGAIIPLDYLSPSPVSTESAFTLGGDGSIFINESGIYMVDAKIQVASDSGAVWGVQVNGKGIAVPYYNSAGVTGNETSAIATILNLCANDFVSLGLVSSGETTLSWGDVFSPGTAISTAAIRLVKIDDYNCNY